jgi:hypothetical protein
MSENVRVPPHIAAIAPDGNLTPRQKRAILLDLGRRKQSPGMGSGHEFMRRRTAVHPWPDLRHLLQGLDWVIVGGVATRAYMPERMTQDLDLLVRAGDGPAVLAIPGHLLRSPQGVEIDLLYGDYPWLDEALARPELDQAGYPVISLPYLVLLKMASSRGRDIGDLTTMLGLASPESLDQIRAIADRYTPADSEDLETLIYLGQREMQSPDKPSS